MKCPFELPVYKTFCAGGFDIRDAKHKLLLRNLTEDEADYIVQAINSYEKLVEALKENYEFTKYAGANKRINTEEYMDEFFNKGLSAQQKAKQALKEAGEPK